MRAFLDVTQRERGVDHTEMGEALREIAECVGGNRIDFLREKTHVIGIGQRAVQGYPPPGYPPPGYPPAGYPPPLGNLQLRRLATGMYLGLSCHSRDRGVPATAVALGAKYLEVHVHLQAEPSALEANVSWDEHEFAALVDSVRHTEHLLG